ncbi:integrase [Longimycelium tulufanense]|uniref:Integrase n=1 Tax=Longimycelium tulufanense TaxID=907463 RepID=A0A8J3CKZ6_9PSEU|nr:IS3 family transposase [Longimycelium tulufanense]GGM84677.1 integrase [Longimycelium tulufanense]
MKVQAVVSLKAEHALDDLLAAAGLARSTFFYHQARLRRGDPQAELKAAITTSFEDSQRRYGHRRVHAGLVKQGWRVAKKTVLTLMRQLALICRVRRRRRYNSFQGEVGKTAPNLLAREFTATAPNQKWVTDVTEFTVGEEKVYLSPIMDLFDRQIIAYQVSSSPTLTLTNTALGDALATLEPSQAPLVHSDQGFQYRHASWRTLLARAGATQSMSRKGNCLDNAVIESFFGHLKEELFHHATFLNAAALTTALHKYIAWYNNDRSHTTLEGLSPVQYRTQALAA